MIQQLSSTAPFSNTRIGAHDCPVPEANTLSWVPQALHTGDTHMYRQIKIFIHITQKQKETLSVQMTQMFSNSVLAHTCPLPVTLSHLFSVCFFFEISGCPQTQNAHAICPSLLSILSHFLFLTVFLSYYFLCIYLINSKTQMCLNPAQVTVFLSICYDQPQ